jgi:hypothetical protein
MPELPLLGLPELGLPELELPVLELPVVKLPALALQLHCTSGTLHFRYTAWARAAILSLSTAVSQATFRGLIHGAGFTFTGQIHGSVSQASFPGQTRDARKPRSKCRLVQEILRTRAQRCGADSRSRRAHPQIRTGTCVVNERAHTGPDAAAPRSSGHSSPMAQS